MESLNRSGNIKRGWFNINKISTKIWVVLVWATLFVVFFIVSNVLLGKHYYRVLTRTHTNGFVILDNMRSLQLMTYDIKLSFFEPIDSAPFAKSHLNQAINAMEKLWAETRQLGGDTVQYREFDNLLTAFADTSQRQYLLSTNSEANPALARRWLELKERLIQQLDVMVKAKRNVEYQYFTREREFQLTLNKVFVIASLVAMALFITLSIWNLNLVTKPLSKVIGMIHELNKGNFGARTGLKGKDEISQLAETLDRFAETLSSVFDGFINNSKLLGASSEELSTSAVQIEKATDEIAKGTDQEADLLVSNKNVILDIANSINLATSEIKDIQKIANESVDQARAVSRSINQIDTSMTIIQESGVQIEDIVSVITDISNRTNLLSLNASIEAAKAGSYGRGFAVVADEVGKLAEKSSQSVVEIRELIETTSQNIQDGTRVIQDARIVLRGIIKLVQQISAKINETTEKLIENNAGMNEIALSAESIVEISERNSVSSQELYGSIKQIAHTLETLNFMAEKVNFELTRFKV